MDSAILPLEGWGWQSAGWATTELLALHSVKSRGFLFCF